MKQIKRLLALLLCAAMLLGLAACGEDAAVPPATTEAPETTAPTEAVTEPPVEQPYEEACAAVNSASDLSTRVTLNKTTQVAGETFEEEIRQFLSFSDIGTDTMAVSSEESVSYSNVYSSSYDEIYADGVLYLTVDDTHRFREEISAGDCLSRYIPAVLLDTSLYASITAEESDSSTLFTFTGATAAEAWAIPEDAKLVEASGTAQLSASGSLQKSTYSVTYTYGSAQITLEALVYVAIEPVTVEAPADPEAYTLLECVDAAKMMEASVGYLYQASTYSSSQLESIYSQAAMVVRNQSTILNTYYKDDVFVSKSETGVFFRDYSAYETYEYDLEEKFVDGVFSYSEDGGEAEEVPDVSASYIRALYEAERAVNILALDYWQEATATDLGSLYLIELTLTDEFGDESQGIISDFLWDDENFLMDLASDYVNTELTAYVGIDKYTGLPTSTGYYFEGSHTISGYEYPLSMQVDQSFTAPSLGAYKAITDEMMPEEEPEVPATPLFYHVTGPDGQEMWLFGTIHIGDNRTAYLPQEIYDALASSDALAIECDTEGFDELYEEDEELQEAVSGAYYYSDGTTIVDHIDPELYEVALKYMKATGSYNMNADYLKPSIWSNSIENFFAYQGFQLTSDQGVEERLTKFAEENGIELREVESSLFQIQMMTGYSEELQELLLEESITYTGESYWGSTMELYELWCAGDEAALMERLSDEVDTSELTEEELAEYENYEELLEEYNTAMSYDRNDGMLEVLKGYLESGDTVFVAVGLAHLLNDVNGLVFTLRDAGYTVELVEYAG